MPCIQNQSIMPWDGFASGLLKPKNGPLARSMYSCERSASEAWRMPSNTSSGRPPGLASVLSISGGTAEISPALATRPVPWRPM
ncbi:hypothetical protein D3C72_2159980 [compost metagenome]